MRVVHTADWHLGHTLAGHSREQEHARFLSWLLELLETEHADALLMCGDVFDHGHPSAKAQHQLYGFIAELRRRLPRTDVVFIGGNHDTAARLDAPSPLFDAVSVSMRGGLPRSHGTVDVDRCLVPVHDGKDIAAICVCVPFLRAADLSLVSSGTDLVVDGTRTVVSRCAERARALYPRVPVIALAHCELEGARLSLSSERSLFGGTGRHALPADLFADAGVDYAALGHLHLAQHLGRDGRARYSGSPIPLSMAERHYQHQVVVVDIDAAHVRANKALVPRTVDFVRVPDDSLGVSDARSCSLDEALDRLRALDVPERPVDERPFLDVRVRLDKPVPDLRAIIDDAIADKPVRLVRVERDTSGEGTSLAGIAVATHTTEALQGLSPRAVFRAMYARAYPDEPSPALVEAFSQLVDDDARNERA